ncbi:MAG: ArsR/SmtB family transcription factor [Hyphomicrobiaceae bacterium]
MSGARFSQIAAMLAEPPRSMMMLALMDRRALTASELARVGGVTPQTASGHLARLLEAGLIAVAAQGRHRYFQIASADVGRMIEGILQVAAQAPVPCKRTGPAEAALRRARTCYDHIAGRLGVTLAEALVERGRLVMDTDGARLTSEGWAFLEHVGLALPSEERVGGRAKARRRVLCRPCLDWSERRPHLAGAVGAALLDTALKQTWVRREEGTRALAITQKGMIVFRREFGIERV